MVNNKPCSSSDGSIKSGCPILTGSAKTVLRNYQTEESVPVVVPKSAHNQDCRHQVCTSSLMNYSPYPKKDASDENWPLPNYTKDQFLQEAKQYLTIYHNDKKTPKDEYHVRLKEIEDEIKTKQSATYTTDELRYGAQLAWRNAARCINRLYWQTLEITDRRDVKTNDAMFEAVCQHIRSSFNGGKLLATVLVLPQNARLWSSQYLRFACYEQTDGTLLGDPANRELTRIAMKIGWSKPETERTEWDVLPVIVQCNPEEDPSWYELPVDCRPIVELSHPDPKYEQAMRQLGLQWFAQPFVADKAIEIGGVVFKCVPFSGWFMETEIGRDLCDVQRYNSIPKLAQIMDLDVTLAASSQLNIDRIYVEVNAAVLHSFQQAQVSIVDHHTAAAGFQKFLKEDTVARGNTPADWVWIVPPISSGMSPAFHQEMMNYLVKPCILDQTEPWVPYFERLRKNPAVIDEPVKKNNWALVKNAFKPFEMLISRINKRTCVTVLYASTTGTAESYAKQTVSRLFKEGYKAELSELDKFSFPDADKTTQLLLIITSTFGRGNAPANGLKTEQWMEENNQSLVESQEKSFGQLNRELKNSCSHFVYAVCAIGSKAYEDFCEFGVCLDQTLENLGSTRLLPVATCDALSDQYKSFCRWETEAIGALKQVFPIKQALPAKTNILTDEEKRSNDLVSSSEKDEFPDEEGAQAMIELSFYDNVCARREGVGPYTKTNPLEATVLMNKELVKPAKIENRGHLSSSMNQHSVRQIELAIKDMPYLAGDHVYIFPENPTSDVEKVIKRCGLKLDDINLDRPCSLNVISNGRFQSMRELISKYVDLVSPSLPNVLECFARYASDEGERKKLRQLIENKEAYLEWSVNRWTVNEVLDEFKSVEIKLHELIQFLPPLQPRPYSISSSPRTNANKLQITVSVVKYNTPNGMRRDGLCSNFLYQTVLKDKNELSLKQYKTNRKILPPIQSHQRRMNVNKLHGTVSTAGYKQTKQKDHTGLITYFRPEAESKNEQIFSSNKDEKANKVRIFVIPNPSLRLPGQLQDPQKVDFSKVLETMSSRLLMFAIGSGIAPFRAFWHELLSLSRTIQTNEKDRMLFIGCRTPNDLLYADELKKLTQSTSQVNHRILTEVVPVYSRVPGHQKRYVQDEIPRYKQIIYSFLADKHSFVFMCGSVRACIGIERGLVSVIESCQPGKPTRNEAEDCIKRMKRCGKIQLEMFG